jgi:transcriptional regulator with XRE-family HTH domain
VNVAKTSGFGKRLKHLREKAGISQYELAKRSGVSPTSLSRIEAETREPTWPTVVKLARALDVPVGEFDSEPEGELADPSPEEPFPARRRTTK